MPDLHWTLDLRHLASRIDLGRLSVHADGYTWDDRETRSTAVAYAMPQMIAERRIQPLRDAGYIEVNNASKIVWTASGAGARAADVALREATRR